MCRDPRSPACVSSSNHSIITRGWMTVVPVRVRMQASETGRTECVELLLKAGAHTLARNSDGECAMDVATAPAALLLERWTPTRAVCPHSSRPCRSLEQAAVRVPVRPSSPASLEGGALAAFIARRTRSRRVDYGVDHGRRQQHQQHHEHDNHFAHHAGCVVKLVRSEGRWAASGGRALLAAVRSSNAAVVRQLLALGACPHGRSTACQDEGTTPLEIANLNRGATADAEAVYEVLAIAAASSSAQSTPQSTSKRRHHHHHHRHHCRHQECRCGAAAGENCWLADL